MTKRSTGTGESVASGGSISQTGGAAQARFSRGGVAASRQFKEWFGKSKVVNRAGQPLVVYHGTPNGKFWTFDKNRVGETWGADETGFFFTSSKVLAEDYTKPYFMDTKVIRQTTLSRRDQVANILSVFAMFTNDLFSTYLVYCVI